MAYFRTGRPVGRRPIFGKAMSGAERQRRYRWMRAAIKGLADRWKTKVEVNMMRDAPADVVGNMLAYVHFDWDTKTANYQRWNAINEAVLDTLVQLERDHPIS